MNFNQKGTLKFLKESIDNPHVSDMGYILSFVDINGKSDLKKFTKRWPNIQSSYKQKYIEKHGNVPLGDYTRIMLQSSLSSYNVFILKDDEISEDAIKLAFAKLTKEAKSDQASIHIQQDENWSLIEKFITDYFINNGVNVVIYQN